MTLNIRGGLEKIKIVSTSKNILNIFTANELEIESQFEDHLKDNFIIIAKRLQKIPFMYSNIIDNTSDTILLRNLLYIPSIYPIISKKNTEIYTRTPFKTNIILDNEIYSIPPETQIYLTELAVDLNKQGEFFPYNEYFKDVIMSHLIKHGYIIPEYTHDTHNTQNEQNIIIIPFKNDIIKILTNLTNQIKYANQYYWSYALESYIFNTTFYFLHHKPVPVIYSTYNITSWYDNQTIKNIKFLLKNDSDWVYNMSPLIDLKNNIDLLLYISTESNSEHVNNYFINKELEQIRHEKLLISKKQSIKQSNLAKRYIIIIEKKLGSELYRKILKELNKSQKISSSMNISSLYDIKDSDTVLSFLTKEQRELVKVEYNRQENYIESYKNNKCSHIEIYKQLIHSKDTNFSRLHLLKLTEYFSQVIDGFHMCKNCKFRIICSHKYEKIKNEIERVPLDVINNNLYNYTIKVKILNSNTYYCKYCGEQLLRDIILDDFEVKKKTVIYEDDYDMRSFIWSVLIPIVKSIPIGNEKQVLIFISNTLRPIIYRQFTIFDNTTKLSIVMHCYAYILKIIKEQKINFFEIKPDTPTSKVAEQLISLINVKYRTLIKELNMTTITLKTEFTNAYKNIIDLNVIPTSNTELEFANFLINIDPIYHFAKTIYILTSKANKSAKNDFTVSPQELKTEFETIMGNSVPVLVKSAKKNVKNPNYSNIINKRFGSVLNVDDIDYFYKIPELNVYSNLLPIDNANKILNDYITKKNMSITERNAMNIQVSYIMLYKYINNIFNRIDYLEFRKTLDLVRSIEEQTIKDQSIYRSIYRIRHVNSHFVKKNIDITRLYDENGSKHLWNIYYYGSKKYNKPPSSKESELTDLGCSVCGIKRSNTSTLDLQKTKTAVNAMSDLHSFYIFYKVRCPVSELHTWSMDRCTKCGFEMAITYKINNNKLDSSVFDYYHKYLNVFEQHSMQNNDITTFLVEKKEYQEEVQHFEWNYTIIIKTAQIFKINVDSILTIGLFENKSYEDDVKSEPIQLINIYLAHTELIYVLSKSKNDIKKDYHKIYKYLLYNKPYEITHKFVIQSICEILLSIQDIEYATEIITTVIHHQKMTSIPTMSSITDDRDVGVYLGDEPVEEDTSEININLNGSYKNIDYSYSDIKYNEQSDKPGMFIYW
jgi:hypothetical protein